MTGELGAYRDTLPVALASAGLTNGAGATIAARTPLPFAGTFPKELVVLQLDDGSRLEVFCKHSYAPGHDGHGHRAGVAYEAGVYRSVLDPLELSAPRFYGSHGSGGCAWLFLEHLDGAARVNRTTSLEPMYRAAAWIGRFHALTEGSAGSRDLLRHDADYYAGWAERTWTYVEHIPQLAWVAEVCEAFREQAASRLRARPTVSHGEYYPKNVLVLRGAIYPVDWETAAVTAGEIDLASLTEGWPPDVAERCEAEYASARWGGDPPDDFGETLTWARLYMVLRWLGDRPEWTLSPAGGTYLGELWRLAESAGIVS